LKRIIAIVLVAALSACAASPTAFYKNPNRQSDASLCKAFAESSDQQFREDLAVELVGRGITAWPQCQQKIDQANIGIGIVSVLAIGTLAAVASTSKLPGGAPSAPSRAYGYAWDQFYDDNRNLVWACRDRSNGQFSESWHCSGKLQVDTTWPSKSRYY